MRYQLEDRICTIERDEFSESPREWDNLGVMVTSHRNYDLGDINLHSKSFEEHLEEKGIERLNDIAVILPLYLMDHSGLSMDYRDFSDFDPQGFDSGCIGMIYVTKVAAREAFNVKRISPKLKEKIKDILKNEVKTYDQYLQGEVYQYTIEKREVCKSCKHEELEIIDSCSGYYSISDIESELNLQEWYKID